MTRMGWWTVAAAIGGLIVGVPIGMVILATLIAASDPDSPNINRGELHVIDGADEAL